MINSFQYQVPRRIESNSIFKSLMLRPLNICPKNWWTATSMVLQWLLLCLLVREPSNPFSSVSRHCRSHHPWFQHRLHHHRPRSKHQQDNRVHWVFSLIHDTIHVRLTRDSFSNLRWRASSHNTILLCHWPLKSPRRCLHEIKRQSRQKRCLIELQIQSFGAVTFAAVTINDFADLTWAHRNCHRSILTEGEDAASCRPPWA